MKLAVLLIPMIAAITAAAQTPRLLIATSKSHDPDFRWSVVLLVRDSAEGAVGLMLNRPLQGGQYAGGPLGIGINALVRSQTKPENATSLSTGVWLMSDRAAINNLRSGIFRVYLGQCGWTSAQLHDEIRRGLWVTAPFQASAVFDSHPDTLWTRLSTASRPRK